MFLNLQQPPYFDMVEVSELPESVDWSSKMSKAPNQGGCGGELQILWRKRRSLGILHDLIMCLYMNIAWAHSIVSIDLHFKLRLLGFRSDGMCWDCARYRGRWRCGEAQWGEYVWMLTWSSTMWGDWQMWGLNPRTWLELHCWHNCEKDRGHVACMREL